MLQLVTVVGIIGTTFVLVGFIGNRLRWWSASDQTYVRVNAVGSLLLIGYSYLIDSYPFIVLNVVWLLFSIKDLFQRR